MKDDELR